MTQNISLPDALFATLFLIYATLLFLFNEEPIVQVTPPLTAFAKAMAVEESYGVQVSDTTSVE